MKLNAGWEAETFEKMVGVGDLGISGCGRLVGVASLSTESVYCVPFSSYLGGQKVADLPCLAFFQAGPLFWVGFHDTGHDT